MKVFWLVKMLYSPVHVIFIKFAVFDGHILSIVKWVPKLDKYISGLS